MNVVRMVIIKQKYMFKNATMLLGQSVFFRRYDSMRSHRFKPSKNPFQYVMSTLQLRFNCIQQFISTYIRTFLSLITDIAPSK